MSQYTEEFKQHWQDVYASVESSIITQTEQQGHIDADKLDKIVKRELSYWNNPYESKGKFMKKLTDENPSTASDFLDVLNGFGLNSAQTPQKQQNAISYGISGAVGIAAFGALQAGFHVMWISALGCVVAIGAASAIASNSARKKHIEQTKEIGDTYLQQIDAKCDELLKILKTR